MQTKRKGGGEVSLIPKRERRRQLHKKEREESLVCISSEAREGSLAVGEGTKINTIATCSRQPRRQKKIEENGKGVIQYMVDFFT